MVTDNVRAQQNLTEGNERSSRVDEEGYVLNSRGTKLTEHKRKTFLIKSNSQGCGRINIGEIILPKEYVGRRFKLHLEEETCKEKMDRVKDGTY